LLGEIIIIIIIIIIIVVVVVCLLSVWRLWNSLLYTRIR